MGSSNGSSERLAQASSKASARLGLLGSPRGVATTKLVGAIATLTLFVCAAYLLFANWQLQHWLRAQSARLGCSLEYASASGLMPGHFRVRDARLSNCSYGEWSALIVKAEGEVALSSLVWGPIQFQRLELELKTLRAGGVALDGKVHVMVENRNGALSAKIRANRLDLRQDGRALASSAHTRIDAEVRVGMGAPRGSVNFALDRFSSRALPLVAEGPFTGSLQLSWDASASRLEAESIVVRTGPWRLEAQAVQATLEVHLGSYSPADTSASGRLLLEGQDVRLVLKELQAPESLSFALSGLDGAPFTLSSTVGYASGTWTFDQLKLDTAEGSVSGAVSIAGANRTGTLRIIYRGLPIGVQFSNGQTNVTFDPPKGLLRSGT